MNSTDGLFGPAVLPIFINNTTEGSLTGPFRLNDLRILSNKLMVRVFVVDVGLTAVLLRALLILVV
jgi:hypothetical protein